MTRVDIMAETDFEMEKVVDAPKFRARKKPDIFRLSACFNIFTAILSKKALPYKSALQFPHAFALLIRLRISIRGVVRPLVRP